MIIIYTGNGKGKTSACIGQAMRALGQGLSVAFAQFIKRDGIAGEQKILKALLGKNFRPGGLGFVLGDEEKAKHAQKAHELLAWALRSQADMLVLDEVLYACSYGLLAWSELDALTDRAGCRCRHLVLSGRMDQELLGQIAIGQQADIITVLQPQRHAYANGITACLGVEY